MDQTKAKTITRTFSIRKEQLEFLRNKAEKEDSDLSKELRKILRQAQAEESKAS